MEVSCFEWKGSVNATETKEHVTGMLILLVDPKALMSSFLFPVNNNTKR